MTADDRSLSDRLSVALGDPAPSSLGIAVSGGSDSLALLFLAMGWAAGRDVRVKVATVDHGLRPEAAAEATRVAGICGSLGVSHETLHWAGWDGRGNLQATARAARYGLLAGWSLAHGLDAVALGHTVDDQAETFLMRLARGAGVDGLAAMRARFRRDGAGFVRPVLGLRRDDLRAYLMGRRIGWCDDPSNADTAFARVKARAVLTALRPLGIDADTLGTVSRNLADARGALRFVTAQVAGDLARVEHGDVVLSRDPDFQSPELIRRLLSGALIWVSGADYPPRREALAEAMRAIAEGRDMTVHGCAVLTEPKACRITREWNAVRKMSCAPDALWDRRWRMVGSAGPGFRIRALGKDGLRQYADWRESGMPCASLLASPSVWQKDTLVSAPIAGFSGGWRAELAQSRGDFAQSLISH